jgi:hypothetical protein
MRGRFTTVVVLVAAVMFVAADAHAPVPAKDPGGLTVHEWGTFTSIAGMDGEAVGWSPLTGTDDLPCFVDRVQFGPKWSLWGTVRMETPVLYFYSTADATVNVNVRFRQGVITEWFPQARVNPAMIAGIPAERAIELRKTEGSASWTNVRIRPRAAADFPRESAPSHYYPARETDAAPVQVGSEQERFLFYRGVGDFAPPMSATVAADGRIAVKSPAGPAGAIVVFDNRGGTVRYHARNVTTSQATIDPASLEARPLASLKAHLESVLTSAGLYPREAKAMIATWADTWFEEGARLFYIVPRKAIDAVLPLDIAPRPASLVRVFVGRMELMTQPTFSEVKSALLTNDQRTLGKYGRFIEPFMGRVFGESSAADQSRMQSARDSYYRSWRPPFRNCGSR